MAVCVDDIGEVRRHVLKEIPPPAFSEAEHDEIRVPVIEIAESAAWHDIRPRQRQQRRIGRDRRLVPGQQRPERVDVPADRDLFRHRRWRGGLGRQVEMRDNEVLQPLRRIRFLCVVERQNLGRRGFRRGVGEILAIGKDGLKLNVRVKVAKEHLWRSRQLECKRRVEEQKNRRN
jgi:hypothetical protein